MKDAADMLIVMMASDLKNLPNAEITLVTNDYFAESVQSNC